MMSLEKSPSSRRAWIEIGELIVCELKCFVALLAEGVDRNLERPQRDTGELRSPSSRRAWIEI